MLRLFAVVIALAASISAPFANEAILAEGRARSEAFLAGDLAGIWDDRTPDMQKAFGTIDGFQAFRDQLDQSFGTEVEITTEDVQPGAGANTYLRTARWTEIDAPVLMQWVILDDDQIAGFMVQAVPVLAESRFLDYQTKTTLRLPFTGEWFVVWGGRTLEQNYHAANPAQRFAVDALIYRDGMTHEGDGSALDSYYCWDQPILAPAGGKVVAAITDLPDNAIGATDPQNPAGNHVVLDFGNGEFAFLGHMRQGSLAVAVGDTVTTGQELGRCGNSGNTSEPHLHFHLQTTADLSTGEGLPAFFEGHLADDKPIDRGELLAGQLIRPEEP